MNADLSGGVRPNGVVPYSISDTGGCTCKDLHQRIDKDCRYHRMAAEQPWNHGIPWNCPTFWDGCNCDDVAEVVAMAPVEEPEQSDDMRASPNAAQPGADTTEGDGHG